MNKATKTVATWLGITAGIAGLEHGYFEILQGNTWPESLRSFLWAHHAFQKRFGMGASLS